MLNYTFNDINIIKYIIKLTYKAGTVDGKRYPVLLHHFVLNSMRFL